MPIIDTEDTRSQNMYQLFSQTLNSPHENSRQTKQMITSSGYWQIYTTSQETGYGRLCRVLVDVEFRGGTHGALWRSHGLDFGPGKLRDLVRRRQADEDG